jgi:hypothetical protein
MRRILILATVIVLVMGAGIAIAQVGDDGVIYACAEEKSGELRLVGNPDDCEKKEVSVSWNQQGSLALANQVCGQDGASVIGFDAAGDIICQVGGATTTTTTTTTEPPTPTDEVCNGFDDDFNGVIDDNLTAYPDDGQAATEASCVSGVWIFTIVEGFCLIDGSSYVNGDVNPEDSMLICNSLLDPGAWTPVGS